MGKFIRRLEDVKTEDEKQFRAKHYHPQLRDEIKQEIVQERKRQDKGRKNTYHQQRQLKSRGYEEE